MVYEFNMPYLQGLLARAQELEKGKEPPDSKQRVDDLTFQGLTNNLNEWQAAQAYPSQPQQPPASLQQPQPQEPPPQPQLLWGDVAAQNVPAADASQNLASQRAREIMQALQGSYSMNSDQFYQRQYDDLILQGYSARRAKAVAGDLAREYQASRVAFLNNAYNNGGRDGLVTNALGNQLLATLGMENPTLANFYANIYPNAKEAYNQQNALEQLGAAQRNALERMGKQHEYNEISADTAAIRASEAAQEADARARANAYRTAEITNQQNEIEYLRNVQRAYELTSMFGLTGERQKAAAAKMLGVPWQQTEATNFKEITKASQDYLNSLLKDEENITKQLTDITISNEQKQILQTQLDDIRKRKQLVSNIIGQGIGLNQEQPNDNWELPAISNDFNENVKSAAEIYSHGGTDEDIRDYYGKKYQGEELERLIKAAKGGR